MNDFQPTPEFIFNSRKQKSNTAKHIRKSKSDKKKHKKNESPLVKRERKLQRDKQELVDAFHVFQQKINERQQYLSTINEFIKATAHTTPSTSTQNFPQHSAKNVSQEKAYDDDVDDMKHEDRAHLTSLISRAKPQKLNDVIKLIQAHMPAACIEDSFELDISTMDSKLLWKIHELLVPAKIKKADTSKQISHNNHNSSGSELTSDSEASDS